VPAANQAPAATAAQGLAVSEALLSRCRDPKCRSALSQPTESRRAFCARGCYDRFHRTRCRVCSEPSPNGRLHAKSCSYAHKQNPDLYAFKAVKNARMGDCRQNAHGPSRNPYKTGIKTREKSRGPTLSDDSLWLATLPLHPIDAVWARAAKALNDWPRVHTSRPSISTSRSCNVRAVANLT
jgi:hypothetical protein